jgi:hypothetical protein
MEKIEEILREKYKRKTGSPRAGTEGRTPIHVSISVEPITPCAINTPAITPPFRQLNFSGRKTAGNTSKQGQTTRGANSRSSS